MKCSRLVIAAMLIGEIVAASTYLFTPTFYDHLEPTVIHIARLYLAGQNMYPTMNGDTAYGLLYGPEVFEFAAIGLRIFPAAIGGKFFGVLACLLAVVILLLILRRHGRDYVVSVNTIITILIITGFGNILYWDRPDSFLFFSVCLACLAMLSLDPRLAAIVVGVMAGFAVNLKLHAVIIFLPCLASLLCSGQPRDRILILCAFVAPFVIALVIPFLPKGISVLGYVRIVSAAGQHGLSKQLLAKNAALAALYITLLIPVWLRSSSSEWRDRGVVICTCLALAVTAIIAAKPGSGPHHLIPFVPLLIYLSIRSRYFTHAGSLWLERPLSVTTTLVCGLLAFTPRYSTELALTIAHVKKLFEFGTEQKILEEVRGIIKSYPEAHFGVAGEHTYLRTTVRAVVAGDGDLLPYDPGALMDLQKAGVQIDLIALLLRRCSGEYWIIPSGEAPFSLVNRYSGRNLFSDEFRAFFYMRYIVTSRGEFFDVWKCKE
jgi:hypothetical protein